MWRRLADPAGNGPSTTDDQVTGWLVAECHAVAGHIAHFALVGERIMATTAAVGALAVSVAVSNGRGYLLMGLPFVLSVVTAYKLYLNQESMALRGYKAGLEEEILRRTGVPVIQYESRVHRSDHNRAQTLAIAVLVMLTLVASGMWADSYGRRSRSPARAGPNRRSR